jgi:ABC-type Fe3+/spermidine/putrescine transport system ATPase subunit
MDYVLFRHMTVLSNVPFGLKVHRNEQRPSDKEISKRALGKRPSLASRNDDAEHYALLATAPREAAWRSTSMN